MAIGKKAVVFTMIAIAFLCLLFFAMNIEKSYTLREQSFITGDRVKSVDFFISDLEKDIQRGTYIAMFRAMLAMQQHITSEGRYLNDTQATFEELLINGTIDSGYVSVMNGTELKVWIAKIQQEAGKVAIRFNYTINSVRLYQVNPWIVSADLNVTMDIFDSRKTAVWKRNEIITESLNITTFEDPLYTANTFGRVIYTIQKSNVTNFTVGTDTSGLLYHVDNKLYIASSSAPSYIMRLSGNLSNSSFGIESIVNLKDLEDSKIDTLEKSCIDYIYFSSSSPPSFLVNNTYNWLRLDNESGHLARYGVTNLV